MPSLAVPQRGIHTPQGGVLVRDPTQDRKPERQVPGADYVADFCWTWDEVDATAERVLAQFHLLPRPARYKVLVAAIKAPEQTAGGILVAEEVRQKMDMKATAGLVVNMGPMAFDDDKKFAAGDRRAIGDVVDFIRYPERMKQFADDQIFFLLNDDAIDGVYPRPEGRARPDWLDVLEARVHG